MHQTLTTLWSFMFNSSSGFKSSTYRVHDNIALFRPVDPELLPFGANVINSQPEILCRRSIAVKIQKTGMSPQITNSGAKFSSQELSKVAWRALVEICDASTSLGLGKESPDQTSQLEGRAERHGQMMPDHLPCSRIDYKWASNIAKETWTSQSSSQKPPAKCTCSGTENR